LQELLNKEKNLRRELEGQFRQRIEFTRALVHEIKTPLSSVLAASELLTLEFREGPWQDLAKHTYEAAYDLNSRIDELLDIAKGEIGMLKLKYKSSDLGQMLRGVAIKVGPEISKKGQSLVLDISTSLPLIQVDEYRLRQVVHNILSNAIKFTPEGGTITLKAGRSKDNLVVKIHDTGPGIAREEQQRLFEAYHRLERDREHFSGLGLGLALSKVLVELHGGQIWVESQLGKGSTFIFTLPLQHIGSVNKVSQKSM
jgi:signal transduction histidine kinase